MIRIKIDIKQKDIELEFNLEKPNKKLLDLFKKTSQKIDDEVKHLNLKKVTFPDEKQAVSDFSEIMKINDKENLIKKVLEFEKAYSLLDPYIGCSLVYDYKDKDKASDFRSGIEYKYLIERIEDSKNRKEKLTLKNIEFTLKLNKDEEYYRYSLNI